MKNDFGKNWNTLVVLAVLVLLICISFLLDIFFGLGVLVGGGAMFLVWPAIKGMQTFSTEENQLGGSFLDTDILRENFQIPQNLPVPYAVLNMRGMVLMSNEKFAQIFANKEEQQKAIEQLLRQNTSGKKTPVQLGEKYYDGVIAHSSLVDATGAVGSVMTLTLQDITQTYALQKMVHDKEVVLGLIVIDNYDEVSDALDESKLPILSAMLERKLGQLAAEAEGIVRKLEKDRFLFLLNKENLEKLKAKKFEALNMVREINVGDHLPATMTIGFGIGQYSLEEAMRNAKQAADLALGRGGDQVLIKDGENYQFFGGKAEQGGRNSRIRARVKADALGELIRESSGVLVMGHKNADLDSMGACLGVSAIVRAMDKKCQIVVDDIGVGVKKLFEVMKTTDNQLHSFAKANEALRMMDEKTLVIVVDTHRMGLIEAPLVVEKAKRIVLFDHHRKSADAIDNEAVLVYHEPYASSTSELITEMIQHIGKKVKLTTMEADALLAGIIVDTKNFSVKTGAMTFEVAAFLRRSGADSTRVRRLFQEDIAAYRAKASAVRDAELFKGQFAISACPPDDNVSVVVAAQAADDLMNVVGVKASFVCCQVGDMVYISARSLGDVNVQRIMERLGGGGHLSVSGSQITGHTLEEVKTMVREAIEQYMEEEV